MNFLSALKKALDSYEQDGEVWYPSEGMVLLGNGGSAAVAAHIANDMNKAGFSASTPDYTTLTCFANDFGWEEALRKWVRTHKHSTNQLVVISSSGRSKNLIGACEAFRPRKEGLITFTGFDPDNPIRKLGHTNYYVPSHNYGIVECAHLAILHSIVNPGEL